MPNSNSTPHQSRSHYLRRFIIEGSVAMAVFTAPLAWAADPPLTLVAAQRRAIEYSRQLAGQDFATTAAREMAVAAGQRPDPVIRMGIDNLPVTTSDRFSLTRDFMTMRRIGVMQELIGDDKLQRRAERFEREADKSLAQKVATTVVIERDTAIAWLELYYAQAMAAVIAETGEQSKLEIQAAEGAYRAGRGSQADVYATHSALVMFEDRASEAAVKVRNAKAMLARWIGEAADQTLAGEPALDTIRVSRAQLEEQLAQHPQVMLLQNQEALAAAEVRIAQANRKSDWTVELAYQQRGPSFSNMVSIGVSIPWQWDQGNRQDRELSAKQALADQARLERDEALRGYVAETAVLINEWDNGRQRQARYQRDLLPLAQARTEAMLAAYRGGKSTLTEVVAARRGEIDVRLQALQLAADTARWWARINFLFPSDAGALQPVALTRGERK